MTEFLAPGTILGSYRLVDLIGEGGVGKVFRAEHTRIGRQVALKVLKPEVANQLEISRRFLEEARAVNEIGHPNIVDIVDFIEDAEHDPPLMYMVMELLPGRSLADELEAKGAMDPEEAVAIATEVCDALVAVHDRKLLHRDLKAENIFLIPRKKGPPAVKVLDFGAIKSLDTTNDFHVTRPGIAIGTPWYMAPEQLTGKPLDERTDIYALGVALFKMLTGRVPFDATDFGSLVVQIVKESPPRITALRTISPPVPPALEAVVLCCLEKDPQDRFSTMSELREALHESLTDTMAVESHRASRRPASTLEMMALARPHYGRIAAIAGTALLLVGLLTFALWPRKQATRDLDDNSGASSAPTSSPGPRAAPPKPQVPKRDQAHASSDTATTHGSVPPGASAQPSPPKPSTPPKPPRSRDPQGAQGDRKRPSHKTTRHRNGIRKPRHPGKHPRKIKKPAKNKRPANLTTVDPFAQ